MKLQEAIKARCCYRGTFTDKPVSRVDLETIMKAGILAPSGKNAQTTRFVAVDDKEILSKIAEIMNIKYAATSTAAIFVITKPDRVYNSISFHVQDYAAATQNMFLTIAELGLATAWVEGQILDENKNAKIGELLGVPNDYSVVIYLPLGYPTEAPVNHDRLPFSQRAWFNHFGK